VSDLRSMLFGSVRLFAPAGDGAAPATPAPGAAPADAAAAVTVPAVAGESPAGAAASPDVKPAESATPAPAATETPQSTPSLLETAPSAKAKADAADKPVETPVTTDTPAPAEVKKDEPKPDAAAAKPDDKAAPATDALAKDTPPAPRSYDAFKVPEGAKLDDEQVKKFTAVLDDDKLDHQGRAQNLIDMHVAELTRVAEQAAQHQRDVWNELNNGWKEDLRKDEVLGGNRLETSLGVAKAVIETFGGTAEQQKELIAHTSVNGMGNYPGFIRLLHNIGVALNVLEDGIVPGNAPSANSGKSRSERWYGKGGAAA
jgi:hypothetical protein